MTTRSQVSSHTKTWDFPIRITHWALALCVVLNFFFIEEGSDTHDWLGYLAVVLIFFRLIWGYFGGPAAKFKPHNPLAALVYILVWLDVIALAVTGWMMDLDRFWGDEWLDNLHANLSTGLQVLIVLHLCGMALDSLRYKRATWMAMIDGRRRRGRTS